MKKYRPKYPHENILQRYEMTNKLIGENMPLISESLIPYMSSEDIKIFNSLPYTVTIYRGTHLNELLDENADYGQSWTLDKNIAEFFAFEHFNSNNKNNRCIIKAEIKKEYIFGYTSCRDESECIINPAHIKIVSYQEYESEVQYLHDK